MKAPAEKFGFQSLGEKLKGAIKALTKPGRRDSSDTREFRKPAADPASTAHATRSRTPPSKPAGQTPPRPPRPVRPAPAETGDSLPAIQPGRFAFRRDREAAPSPTGHRRSIRVGTLGRPGADPRVVAIGIDLGTSSTKIVIRDFERETAFAVPIGRITGGDSTYLLPSRLSLSKDGVFRLDGQGEVFWDFKTDLVRNGDNYLPVAEGFPRVTPLEIAAAYLSIALSHVRAWAAENRELRAPLRNFEIVWHLNIGMPTNALDGAHVADAFRIAGLAGWLLAGGCTEPSLGEVRRSLLVAGESIHSGTECPATDSSAGMHPDQVQAYPEIVAEVSGYAKSRMRRPGLHFMLDVGAGTLDLATFCLVDREENDRYAIAVTRVYALGAARLFKHRLDAVTRRFGVETIAPDILKTARSGNITALSRLPGIPEIAPGVGDSEGCEIDSAFARDVQSACAEVLRATCSPSRYPKAGEWDTGLPIFFCGGGASEALYAFAVEQVERRFPKARGGLRKLTLPHSRGLFAPGLPPSSFHRIAVADGLAWPEFAMDEAVSPESIPGLSEDESRPVLDVESLFISKDQV